MGNFSRNTFDKSKQYVGVRLQEGVPILDADWNELEDTRKYELQTFLKWFVGNGVLPNSEAFQICAAANPNNDFKIMGAGHCLVEGWDVFIEQTLNYTDQSLYKNGTDAEKAKAARAKAQQWGVKTLPQLTTPIDQERTDLVYLDIWEREVDANEDDDLIDPNLGIETCVRLKREWVVRVAEGTSTLPTPSSGHVFYPLASLQRQVSVESISTGSITDLRTTVGSHRFESQWISSQDADTNGWIDIAVGFLPKNVAVMAQIAENGGTYGDNYTQIQPASLEKLKQINLISETCFIITSDKVKIFIKSVGSPETRFKVYAWK